MGETQGFKVRVGVILPHQGKILLARQNQRDFWVFPGGTLEPGEGLAECAVREIQEEANLTIAVERLLYVADFLHPARRQTVDVFFLGRYCSGELQMTEQENLDDLGFFTPSDVQAMALMPQLVAQQMMQDWVHGFQGVCGQYLGQYGPQP